MNNNKSIAKCKQCDDYYCYECSDNKGWESFCSDRCEKEYIEKHLVNYKFNKKGK